MPIPGATAIGTFANKPIAIEQRQAVQMVAATAASIGIPA